MPLTDKGKKILAAMQRPKSQGGYGREKGKSVFYASINKGRISNVERRNTVRSIRKRHAEKFGRY